MFSCGFTVAQLLVLGLQGLILTRQIGIVTLQSPDTVQIRRIIRGYSRLHTLESPAVQLEGKADGNRRHTLALTAARHAVETLVDEHVARFERQVEQVRKTDIIQQTDAYGKLVVVAVIAVGTCPARTDKRYEVPRAGLLVTADGIRKVPHHIAVQIRHAELLVVDIARNKIFGISRLSMSPPLGIEARITQSKAHARRDPLADVHVDGRGQTFAELPVGVGLAMIYVHTAAHTDPDVVEEAVRLVRTAHDLVVCVAVAVLLCHGNHRNEAHGYAQNSFDQYLLVHYFMY